MSRRRGGTNAALGLGAGLALGALGGVALGSALAPPQPVYVAPAPPVVVVGGDPRQRRVRRLLRRRYWPYPVYANPYYTYPGYYPPVYGGGIVYAGEKANIRSVAPETYESVRNRLATLGNGIDVEVTELNNAKPVVRAALFDVAGTGLIATRAFRAGDPITEYQGRLVDWLTESLGDDRFLQVHIPGYWRIDGEYTIDGTRVTQRGQVQGGGAWARVRDGDTNAEIDFIDSPANIEAMRKASDPQYNGPEIVLDPKQRITFLRATRDIAVGEEIFLNE